MPETKENDDFGLTADELKQAQEFIDKALPGRYTLKKLYDKTWKTFPSLTKFGERFAASLTAGHLKSIAFYTKKTGANAMQYDVKGGPLMID
jgi:hypothetical protein